MRTKSYQQFAIVVGDSAQSLTEQLNVELFKLREKSPTVEFDGLTARISYTETVRVAEAIDEEYAMAGVSLSCQDCPFFNPRRKADGSEDLRAKRGGCQFAPYGQTFRDRPACERLFQMLNRGEIRLCLAE